LVKVILLVEVFADFGNKLIMNPAPLITNQEK